MVDSIVLQGGGKEKDNRMKEDNKKYSLNGLTIVAVLILGYLIGTGLFYLVRATAAYGQTAELVAGVAVG